MLFIQKSDFADNHLHYHIIMDKMDYHLHGKANLTELVHQTKDVLAEKKKSIDIFIMFCIIVM